MTPATTPASDSAAKRPNILLDLSGSWELALDPEDAGSGNGISCLTFSQTIELPGSLPENGIGNSPTWESPWIGMIKRIEEEEWPLSKYDPYRAPENFKMPFWLQPDTLYVGPAWYQKKVEIPAEWESRHITLFLERPHWVTRVWVDGEYLSEQDSLSVPHVHDLSAALTPGSHTLTVQVDNRMVINVGTNSHSMSDHTQGNWNGMAGRMELQAVDPLRLVDVQVFPDLATRSARVKLEAAGMQNGQASVHWSVTGPGVGEMSGQAELSFEQGEGGGSFTVELGENAERWDEFSPSLYTLNLKLGNEGQIVRFGLREFTQRGKQFAINGRKVLLRGTLECCAFPLTGYPPVDRASWEKEFGVCVAHGLNHIRFHSWCPPKAAFDVADEMGLYLQVECASWANGTSSLGDGKPVDEWLYAEGKRIIQAYGNHPSFVMMTYGNEPGGEQHEAYLGDWLRYWKAREPRRVHTSGGGWPVIAENQYHNIPDPRLQRWGEGLKSRINGQPPETVSDYREYVEKYEVPVVSHEIGQWCVYPDFDEVGKYTGYLKPKNFEIFREFLIQAGLEDQARAFLLASGKLQVLAYKEDVEASLRTDGFGGFQLLALNDFPGQGTALVGVLDAFWEAKPYLAAEEFRRFCAPVVPLARLPKRIFSPGDSLDAGIEIAHYGPEDLRGARVCWEISGTHLHGSFEKDLRCGQLNAVEELRVSLEGLVCPARYTLKFSIADTPFENSWDVWMFPKETPLPEDRRMLRELDDAAVSRLEAGETLWLQAAPSSVDTNVALGFSPIFWNTAWTRNQAPHTLGILCDPAHAALAEFPTEFHSNWQWWYVVSNAATMELPGHIRPIVQVVPDWFSPQCLGLAFEARVGNGRLLVTSIDFAAGGPVGHQLFRSLLAYLDQEAFAPPPALSVESVRKLFRPT